MKRSPVVIRWAKAAFTVVLLCSLFFALDTRKLADAVFRISPLWMALGAALSFLFVFLRMLKWKVLSSDNGLHASSLAMLRSMLFALALGIVTPGRVGEVAAILPCAPAVRGKAVMAYVYDRVGELGTVILFCVPAALVFVPGWGVALGAALTVGTAGIVAIMEARALRSWLIGKLPARFPQRVGEILKAPVCAPARYWLLSLATYVLAYASVAAFIAGAEPLSTFRPLLVLPVVTLSNLLTITIGGLGVREGLAALVSPAAGLTPEVTAAAFFLSFFWTRLVPGLVGLIWTTALGYPFRADLTNPSPGGENGGK